MGGVDDGAPGHLRPRGPLALALLLAALLALHGLGSFPLLEPDEGRYAEIGRAMARDGDWVTPRLSGIAYYEKPPLAFWLMGAATRVLGAREAAVRLPSALAFALLALVVARFGERVLGRGRGVGAALVLCTLPLAALFFHLAMVDGVLTLLTTATLFAGALGLVAPAPGTPVRRPWVLAAWALTGLGVLTKGPVAAVLPWGSLLVCLALLREWRRIGAALRPDGPLLLLVVAAPWYVAMGRARPGYLYEFFVEQNLQRLTSGGRFDRDGSLLYYVPILLGTFAPWTLLLPRIAARLRTAGRAPTDEAGRLRLLCACAVAVPFAVLSLAGSKLAYYILPLAPPFALLVADVLLAPGALGRWRRAAPVALGLGVLLLLAAAVGLVGAAALDPAWLARVLARGTKDAARIATAAQRAQVAFDVVPVAAATFALGGLCWLEGARRFARHQPRRAFAALGASVVVAALGGPHVIARLGPAVSSREQADVVLAHGGAERPVLCFATFTRGLAFYLDHPVYQWDARHAEFGREVAPGTNPYALQCDADALCALLDRGEVVIVSKDEDTTELLGRLAPGRTLRRVATVGPRVILVGGPAPGTDERSK